MAESLLSHWFGRREVKSDVCRQSQYVLKTNEIRSPWCPIFVVESSAQFQEALVKSLMREWGMVHVLAVSIQNDRRQRGPRVCLRVTFVIVVIDTPHC
jgi:hypothetical protein